MKFIKEVIKDPETVSKREAIKVLSEMDGWSEFDDDTQASMLDMFRAGFLRGINIVLDELNSQLSQLPKTKKK